MKGTALRQSSPLIDVARQTIFEQRSLLMSIRRSAWWLYRHEVERGYSPYDALDNVLKWMAEQAEMLERVKREPTQMQRRMLQMLADGYTQKQIAMELGKNVQTMKQHFYKARERLGVETMYQLMAVAVRKGWVKVNRTGNLENKKFRD